MGYPIQIFASSSPSSIKPAMNADGEPIYADDFKSYVNLMLQVGGEYYFIKGPIKEEYTIEQDGTLEILLYGSPLSQDYGRFRFFVNEVEELEVDLGNPNAHYYHPSNPFTKRRACMGSIAVLAGDVIRIERYLFGSWSTSYSATFNYGPTDSHNYDDQLAAWPVTPGWP